MKYLCEKCDEYMDYRDSIPLGESVRITFVCPKCKYGMSMITNPGETQLVHSLGVKIGGRKTKTKPLELTRTTLKQKQELNVKEPVWSKEAEEKIRRVPTFARGMAKRAVERVAREKGYKKITPEVVEEVREKMGM